MQESLHSQQWYRIAEMKPRVRSHVTVSRHTYRGKLWFVYRDETTGRTHRFSEFTHRLIALMNGTRTTTEIWDTLVKHLREQAPSQDTLIQLLHYLRSHGLLVANTGFDVDELVSRSHANRKADWKRRFSNPLSLRIKLLNPDRFLINTIQYVNWAFRRWFFPVWPVTIILAILLAAANWEAIRYDASINAFTTYNIFALIIIYPVVKLLHELAHAYAIKHWGGEVNELGVMLLLLVPVPYVNASSATSFPKPARRIAVSAAGIVLELVLASLGLFVWLASEDGLVRQVALNVMLIGSISTLLFNGNPLLRYDAYYVLSDMLGSANLAPRSNRYIGYLIHRYCFGISNAVSPAQDSGERLWLFFYAILSFLYRVSILAVIVIFLSDSFFILGAALAVWAVVSQIVLPTGKLLKRTVGSPTVRQHGARAIVSISLFLTVPLMLIFYVPFPHRTVIEGVIVPNDDSQIRAEIDGEVKKLFVRGPSDIGAGEPIIELSNPEIDAQIDDLAAQVEALRIQYTSEWGTDPSKAEQTVEQLRAAESQLIHAKENGSRLIVRSSGPGRVIVPNENDLLGRFVTQGTTIAYLESSSLLHVKAAVTQEDAPFLQSVDDIEIKFKGSPSQPVSAQLTSVSPSATNSLPSPVLTTEGGGKIQVETAKDDQRLARGKYVVIDLRLTGEPPTTLIGQRVYVRMSHGTETVFERVSRAIRQVFLGKFDV